MLPCEANPRPPLSRAEFARVLPLFLYDYVLVVQYALRTFPPTSTMQRLCEAIFECTIPPLSVLNRVVGFVLFELTWKQDTLKQPLTPDEETILTAAWRLSDGMHGSRHTQ